MGVRQSCGKACAHCTADCTRPAHGFGDDFDDERPGGDPAGATFEETLEDLNSLDRHLMLFCATSNLSAVRWLLHLGAHWDTTDANGTSCLHVACRAGTLAIVKEMMEYQPLLQATDMAGWTALHIAVLMGRRQVVVRLLQDGASSYQRNSKGQTPMELCADNATFEVLRSFELHCHTSPHKPWSFSKDMGPSEDIIESRLQYEPFFVPRQPAVRSLPGGKKALQRLGTLMFNQQPGYGLAFLVAVGAARDYPVDLSTFLRRSKVDIKQVGSFLGEAFSLSHTIRLEFINSVVLQNSGVVSALARVFRMLQLPDDLQKINRLVHGVARIWWRQHERMAKEVLAVGSTRQPQAVDIGATGGGVADDDQQTSVNSHRLAVAGAGGSNADAATPTQELVGLELKQYLSSSDVLHQLMFSTVLLHWYVHTDGSGVKRDLGFAVWQKLNRGIEAGAMDVPEHVQRSIYDFVCRSFIVELAVAPGRGAKGEAGAGGPGPVGGGPDEGGGHGPSDDWAGAVANERQASAPVLSPNASLEGWSQVLGGGFPRPSGLSGVQPASYKHMSSIFSEVTSSSPAPKSPVILPGGREGSRSAAAAAVAATAALPGGSARFGAPEAAIPGGSSGVRRDDFSWLSICCALLFFSASSTTGAPYAFLELERVQVASAVPTTCVITLVGARDAEDSEADLAATGAHLPVAGDGSANIGTRPGSPVTIILLLPDGRWQELHLPRLELRFASSAEMLAWVKHVTASSGPGKPMQQNSARGGASLPNSARASPRRSPREGAPAQWM